MNIKSILFMNNINLWLFYRFDVLLVTGVKFRGLKDSEQIQQQVFDYFLMDWSIGQHNNLPVFDISDPVSTLISY